MPTSATQWTKPRLEGVEITLPSGNEARIRPMNMETFIRSGRIPDTLTPVVEEMLYGKVPEAQTLDTYLQNTDLLNVVCETCFIEPKVAAVADPENGIISFDDIDEGDKQHILAYLGRPALLLRSFRSQQENPVDDLLGGKSNEPVTESGAGGGGVGRAVPKAEKRSVDSLAV